MFVTNHLTVVLRVACCALLCLAFAAAGTSIVFSQTRTILIGGRAVDTKGDPVSNAEIFLDYPPCHSCFEHILPSGRSLPDGVFFIEYDGQSFKQLRLFLEGPVPSGYWSPILLPLRGGASRLPEFRGIPIHAQRHVERIDVGDVTVILRYAKVKIDLAKTWRENLNPTRDEFKEMRFTLRSKQGQVVYSGRLTEPTFDFAASTANLALPNGTWILEFSISRAGRRILSPRRVININTLSCINVTLTDKQVQKPCEND